jgi:GMP synthase PP-ATPase subunit
MGRIINSINTDEDFAVFFGEKGLLKLDFTESLCVYLYERKVINNYEIFRIYSELDFTDMKNKINDENQKLKLINQKNVKVIKFDNNNFENNIKYFK